MAVWLFLVSISGHLTINLHHFQLINQKFLFSFGKEWFFLSLLIKITRSFDKHFFRFFVVPKLPEVCIFFFSDTIFQKRSKVVKVMVVLKLCTKICKCTERCARVDFPPTGSKWRSCGSTPLKTTVFKAIVNYVLLHRTSWLRMRAWGPAVVLLRSAKAISKRLPEPNAVFMAGIHSFAQQKNRKMQPKRIPGQDFYEGPRWALFPELAPFAVVLPPPPPIPLPIPRLCDSTTTKRLWNQLAVTFAAIE